MPWWRACGTEAFGRACDPYAASKGQDFATQTASLLMHGVSHLSRLVIIYFLLIETQAQELLRVRDPCDNELEEPDIEEELKPAPTARDKFWAGF